MTALLRQLNAAALFRERMLELTTHSADNCGILLSAGVDSNTILYALLENEIKPTVYSIRCVDQVSTDWSHAKRIAELYDLKFRDCVLPQDTDDIYRLIQESISYGMKRKADIECFAVWKYVIDYAAQYRETTLYRGLEAYHATTRKDVVEAYNGNLTNIEWFQQRLYRDKDVGGSIQMRVSNQYAQRYGIQMIDPHADDKLRQAYSGLSWADFHLPRQKMPMRLAFKQIQHNRGKGMYHTRHINLQNGDSGITELFERLLKSKYNLGNHKSVVGIYNALVRNRLAA